MRITVGFSCFCFLMAVRILTCVTMISSYRDSKKLTLEKKLKFCNYLQRVLRVSTSVLFIRNAIK